MSHDTLTETPKRKTLNLPIAKTEEFNNEKLLQIKEYSEGEVLHDE